MKQKSKAKKPQQQEASKPSSFTSIALFLGIVIIFFLGAFLLLRFVNTKTTTPPKTVKVGILVPLTGESSSLGNSIQKAVALAVKDLKAENIELVALDSSCSAEGVNLNMPKLVAEKVVAVIGDVCSGGSLAALPYAEKNKIVLVSPGSTSVVLDNKSPYFFRTIPSDLLQVNAAANLLKKDGIKTIGVLYTDEPYGLGFLNGLKSDYVALGGKIISVAGIPQGEININSYIANLLKPNPDAVFIVSNSDTVTSGTLRQIRSLNKNMRIYGTEGLKSSTIINDAGNAAEGIIATSLHEEFDQFIQNYKAEYGVIPDQYAVQGYDAFAAIYKAMQLSAASGEELKDSMKKVNFKGYSGDIKFSSTGSVSGTFDVFIVKNGEYIKRE